MKVLIVAEHAAGRLAEGTARCVACARELAPDAVDVVVFAEPEAEAPVAAAARLAGITRVIEVRGDDQRGLPSAVLAPRIAALAIEYTHVLAPSSTFGKDLMPRAAALLGVGQISDIMAVESAYRFKRPIYAGNVVATVEADPDRVLVGTVRSASYRPVESITSAAPIERRALDEVDVPAHTRVTGVESARSDRPDLQTARRVVAGGRALGSAEGFALVRGLADRLGAAIGASRAAVDAGLASNDLQVGQTGKVIAPELYIAVGISGAIQHLTGIKDAGTIVAINKDPDAPIFDVADIGLVADLFEAVPALIDALARRQP
jgi:electron transfer flavoprotein alpha subunit